MKYRFPQDTNLNYAELKKFLHENEELTKDEFLEKCAGQINLDLFQNIKEIGFDRIGKDKHGEIYLK